MKNQTLSLNSIKIEDGHVFFKNDQETKDKIFNKLLDFFKKHRAFCGESIMQCDDPQIYAPELLAEIADEDFQFELSINDGNE